ncbi:asialoglycoprotein receptor 1-like [Rana temporaria]|uniref:asialoglycoprotein receptor 1-like n=1 Tax=Rana temporaria TaxID=8407 RepID=UPI001AACC4F7|nr:asialoglycoprotein receptor 1-like [Rana temporaria]
MARWWIPQPSSTLICLLSSLCTGLLFITIILLVTITREGVDQTDYIMEVKLRNLSLGVQSRVKDLSQHDSSMMEKLKALETFVKDLRKSDVMSKVVEIESSMKRILSDEIAGSLSNDHQRILAALGDLADEIWKGNSSVDPLCDKGWLHQGTSCYYRFPKIQPWMDAKKSCEDKKAHLVVINSQEEMDFLRVISRSSTSWIGLKKQDGSWQWVDGTPLDKTPKFWKPGQPDNYVNEYEDEVGGEDCAHLVDADSWYDTQCSRSYGYICEKIMS